MLRRIGRGADALAAQVRAVVVLNTNRVAATPPISRAPTGCTAADPPQMATGPQSRSGVCALMRLNPNPPAVVRTADTANRPPVSWRAAAKRRVGPAMPPETMVRTAAAKLSRKNNRVSSEPCRGGQVGGRVQDVSSSGRACATPRPKIAPTWGVARPWPKWCKSAVRWRGLPAADGPGNTVPAPVLPGVGGCLRV